jgi:uncharacterized protein YwqG
MTNDEKDILAKKLLEIAKREIRIDYSTSDEEIECGESKIGGKPDLPTDFDWPYYSGNIDGNGENKNRPLSFLAQINLKDVVEYDKKGLLPKDGLLSFFYELETMTWGFDPADLGSAKVFYFSGNEELNTTEFPDDMEDEYKLPELHVDFSDNISFPSYEELLLDEKPEWDDYDEYVSDAGYDEDDMGERTKMLGYPDLIQNPMQEQCEAVNRGYRVGSSEDYSIIPEDVKASIKENADEWILLFQMGTIEEDDFELMFGDCGHIYFWIRKSDLLEKNFSNVWLVLQC